jgi:hypothetical protein
MNLDELIAALNAYANQDELIAKIKTNAKRVYQVAFNDGHAVATGQAGQQETKLKTDLQAAKDAQKAAEDALREFKSTSNVEELRSTYDKRIAEKDAEINKLKTESITKDRERQVGSVRGKTLSNLKSAIDDDKADALIEAPKVASRIKFDEATNRVQIYQTNGVPFAGSEDEQVAALVEELKGGVPDTLLKSTVEAGSGRESVTPIATAKGGVKKGKEFYASIRNGVAKKTAATTTDTMGLPPERDLEKRLGLRER